MKFFSLAALLALAVALTDAALCTFDDLDALEKKPEVAAVRDACQYKKVDELIPKTDAETKDICAKNKDCVKAITAAKPVITCEISGDELLYHYTHAQNRLDTMCAKVAASSSISAASSGAIATTALAVAVAAVAYA